MALPTSILNLISARADELGISPLDPETDLFQSGILDSFALAALISIIEDELGLTIPDSEVDENKFRSIASILEYVKELRSK